MSTPANHDGRQCEVPCQLLPETEFDLAADVAPEKLARAGAGGLAADEVVHEPTEFDSAPKGTDSPGHPPSK